MKKQQTSFINQKYLNLKTVRKNGKTVETPVWFVEDQGIFYVRTYAESGKIKRIRNQNQVSIAPCKMDGTLLGDWVEASARIIEEPEIDLLKIDGLLGKKYGIMKFLFGAVATIQGRKETIIEIKF